MNTLYKYGFLFGAGAEVVYKLHNGGEYTYKTTLHKLSKMYNELRKFYKKD